MKTRLLDWLVCPMCGDGSLALEAWRESAGEIAEGLLTCGSCARTYPIINGIPRMLPDALRHLTVIYNEEIYERYGDR